MAELKKSLENSVAPIRLIRNLQVLGAYGFRGLVQKKEHFIKSIGNGIENLYQTSEAWNEMNEFPELKKLINSLKESKISEAIKNVLKI